MVATAGKHLIMERRCAMHLIMLRMGAACVDVNTNINASCVSQAITRSMTASGNDFDLTQNQIMPAMRQLECC